MSSSIAACSLNTTILLAGDKCPVKCQNSPSGACVLYGTGATCQNTVPKSGNCTTDVEFPLQATTTECNLTYACPNLRLLRSGTENNLIWNFFVANAVVAGGQSAFVGAPITELGSLGSGTSEFMNVQGFQLTGNVNSQPKGTMQKIKYPATFFSTYPKLTRLFLLNMDVSSELTSTSTGKLPSKLEYLTLLNANLDSVPLEVQSLTSLVNLDLSNNKLTAFSGLSTPTVTTLNLAGNNLVNYTDSPSNLQTLNLSRNSLPSFPYAIFNSSNLNILSITNNGLQNVVLDKTQANFLSKLQQFDADFTITTCPEGTGYDAGYISNTQAKFCITGVNNQSSSSLSTLAIVLIAIGGVIVVALIGLFLYWRRRKAQEFRTSKPYHDSWDSKTNPDTVQPIITTGPTVDGGLLSDPELLAVRIDYQEVQEIQLISRGGFGEVWSGIYLGRPVAIKRLLPEKRTWEDAMNFAMEIKMMTRLNHRNIVEFIGAAWTNALSIQAISEYMNCGDLKSLLDRSSKNHSGTAVLTWANIKLHLAIDVADALVYLHSLNPKFIHRDLKSRNILIDADNGAKLSDFGISRNRSLEETMTAGVGTCRWMAPEVIQGAHYDEAVDIYSFGCVLSEMDTCNVPYFDATHTNGSKLQDHAIMSGVVQGTLKPSFTKDCPREIVEIAMACLETDPKKRPTSTQLAYLLRKYRKELERLSDTNSVTK